MEKAKKIPEVVYKYRNWSNKYHKQVLEENCLFLSSPKDFNDPFDCRISQNFLLLDTFEKKQKYVLMKINETKDEDAAKGVDIEQKIKIGLERIQDNVKYQNYFADNWFSNQDKYYGIVSFSADWDSILMWSHYSDNHKGICIGFNEIKLRYYEKFGRAGMVDYNDNFPLINPLVNSDEEIIINAFTETHTKAKKWKYEKEYRLSKTFYPHIPSLSERIVKIPDDFFTEVILGLCISTEHKEEVLKICEQKAIPVYQSLKVPLKFKLHRERIL